MRRNLLYHIYPVCKPWGSDIWKWNVDRIRGTFWQFDRLIFSVALDDRTDPEEDVRKYLGVRNAEFLIRPNNPRWESDTLIEKLALVESLRDDEVTFYGHAKGSSREPFLWENIKAWTGAMYLFNLGSYLLIDHILDTQSAVGCFQCDWPNHGGSDWHFAGNFFWVKHSALFSQPWRNIEPTNLGAEGYIGRHIPKERATCLYRTDVDPYLTKLDENDYSIRFRECCGDHLP